MLDSLLIVSLWSPMLAMITSVSWRPMRFTRDITVCTLYFVSQDFSLGTTEDTVE